MALPPLTPTSRRRTRTYDAVTDNTGDVFAAVEDELADKADAVHTHLLAAGATDVTMTAANLNTLDDGVNSTLHFHAADRDRANHTGTQLAATISDFSSAVAALVVDANPVYWIRQGVDYTLTNSTARQKLFNVSAAGALSLAVGQYEFAAMILMDSMSATIGNGQWSLLGAGTCTLSEVLQVHGGRDTATPATLGAMDVGFITAENTTGVVATATTDTVLAIEVRGSFKVTAAGTIIPSFTLDTAAAAVVKAGSWMRVLRLGSNAANHVGWS